MHRAALLMACIGCLAHADTLEFIQSPSWTNGEIELALARLQDAVRTCPYDPLLAELPRLIHEDRVIVRLAEDRSHNSPMAGVTYERRGGQFAWILTVNTWYLIGGQARYENMCGTLAHEIGHLFDGVFGRVDPQGYTLGADYRLTSWLAYCKIIGELPQRLRECEYLRNNGWQAEQRSCELYNQFGIDRMLDRTLWELVEVEPQLNEFCAEVSQARQDFRATLGPRQW